MGIDPSQLHALMGGAPPDQNIGPVPPGAGPDPANAPPDPAGYGDAAGGMTPGLDAATGGDPNAALAGGQGMPSLDPQMLASILFQTLKRMQEDDKFAAQMQVQMAMQAMGAQQQVAAEQALSALQDQMAADGQMLQMPGDMQPPGVGSEATPAEGVGRQLDQFAYPA